MLGDCTPVSMSRGTHAGIAGTNAGTAFLISVSPNPASNYFTVTVRTKNTNETVFITVYDVTGKQVLVNNVRSSGSLRIGEALKSGIYFIKVQQGYNIIYEKLLKTN